METFHIILVITAAVVLALIVFLEISRRKTQKEERSWMDIKHEITNDPLEIDTKIDTDVTTEIEPEALVDILEQTNIEEESIAPEDPKETQEILIDNEQDTLIEVPELEDIQQVEVANPKTQPDDQHEFDFPEPTLSAESTLEEVEEIEPFSNIESPEPPVEVQTFHSEYEEVFALSVMAQDDDFFEGADLMREFTAQNLQFGEMGFYHRAMPGMQNINLFSVANIMQPGDFDQQTMLNLKTKGLLLFMRLPGKLEPVQAFDQFYDAADALAITLGGKICDEHRNALSQHRLGQIRDKIRHLALKLELERKKASKNN